MKMVQKGGKREGAGRKPKADEKKVNTIFVNALKKLYNLKDDDQAKEQFVATLLESQRGQLFIAEHLFGKPKETIESNVKFSNFDIRDVISFKK